MLILMFKCATDRTTKTKWWSLTSLVLWAFDFWSQGGNTGLWRSQFKITWIRRHHIGRGLEADSRCFVPPGSRGRQCCNLESQKTVISEVFTSYTVNISLWVKVLDWWWWSKIVRTSLTFYLEVTAFDDISLKTIRWHQFKDNLITSV